MPKEIHGKLTVGKEKYGIVVTRFNEFITSRLLGGAIDALNRHGANDSQSTVVWVPGAFEVPLAAKKMAQSGKFDAIICLATVIRGQTAHFDYVCQQITRGVGEVSMISDIPVLFGVITCDTLDEAINRAGAKSGNVGYNAALSAIEMVQVISEINKIQD